MSASRRVLAVLASAILLAGCEPRPGEIAYGEDTCARCVMGISDARFGAQIVTSTGKIHRFDSVECLAGASLEMDGAEIHSIWVSDFESPGTFVRVEHAVFLSGSRLNSPMGMSLLAFADRTAPLPLRATYGGELIEWPQVLDRVAAAAGDHADHMHAEIGSAPSVE